MSWSTGLTRLEHCHRCVNTSLVELPSLLISNCPKLETVTFNQSLIHTIHPNAIAHLPKLQQVYVSVCCDES